MASRTLRIFLTLSLLTLSSCGDGGFDFSQENNHEESGRTRFAAVEAHPQFSKLIGALQCDFDRMIARSSFHEANVEVQSEEETGRRTIENVRVLIDQNSNMAIIAMEGGRGESYSIKRNNVYTISGNTLTIERVGTITAENGYFVMNLVNGTRASRMSERTTGSTFVTSEIQFKMICGSNDQDTLDATFRATSETRESQRK